MNNPEQMLKDNIRLVGYAYNKLHRCALTIKYKDDLISEGTLGLWNGCKTYDETKNIKVSSYLYTCIRNNMLVFLRKYKTDYLVDSLDAPSRESSGLCVGDLLEAPNKNMDCQVITEYCNIYFKYYKKTERAAYMLPRILVLLSQGYNFKEIARLLGVGNVFKYIEKIRYAILKEQKDENMA